MPMWMRWWSSARPSPPQKPSSLALSPPPRESTTSSLWCSNTASPRLQRRRTLSTERWAARSLSAPGWTPSWGVRTCSKQHIRSTGKAARHRPLAQPKPIPKCQVIWWTYPGANCKVNGEAMLPALNWSSRTSLSFPFWATHYDEFLKGTYTYLQPPFHSLKGSSNIWSSLRLKAIYGPDWEEVGMWMEGERWTVLCIHV